MVIKSEMPKIMEHLKAHSDASMFLNFTGNLLKLMERYETDDSQFHDVDVLFCTSEYIAPDVVARLKVRVTDNMEDEIDLMYVVGVDEHGIGVDVITMYAFVRRGDKYTDVVQLERAE